MTVAPLPENEKERLEALREYFILDTLPEKDFDDITKLASDICGLPISTITLIDPNRQWFKSNHGLTDSETPRDLAFCAHAINKPDEIMIVPDSRMDKRFFDNPLVTGAPNVIFYAGIPLTNPDGFTLGTLCVIDNKPRVLNEKQYEALKTLASMVVKLLELRKKNLQLEESQQKLRTINKELEKFAFVVSHDMKSPLSNIMALTSLFKRDHAATVDAGGIEILNHLAKSADKLKIFIDDMLHYYRNDQLSAKPKEKIELHAFLKSIIDLIGGQKEFVFNYPQGPVTIFTNKIALEQILINLITNSIKYNNKEKGVVDVMFSENEDFYSFTVKDNGSGMDKVDLTKIFDLFVNLGKRDRFENVGSGIGLSSVKKIVENLGGELTVTSEPNVGSAFTFTIKK